LDVPHRLDIKVGRYTATHSTALSAGAAPFYSQGRVGHRMHEWNDSQPIYRQLRDRGAHMILDGVLKEGDPLPSVRNVAAEYRVNPLTVLKAYQQLVDEQLVETKRGLGMFVKPGARDLLLKGEREKFLAEEWPRVAAKIQRLGLTSKELDAAAAKRGSKEKEK
jgi:GntR family transcriptional regulator